MKVIIHLSSVEVISFLKAQLSADEIILDDLSFRFPETVQHHFNEAKMRLLNGEKLTAIKSIREIFNMGLKEAKDVIDLWQETGLEPDLHDLLMRYGYRKQSY